MAKLIFEDDEKNQHEIDMSTIKTKSLSKDDMILVNCEIGIDTPPMDANEYLDDVYSFIQKYFLDNKIIVTAMRNGKKDIDLKIVKNKE